MKITEEIIRNITLLTMEELGENATPENIKQIVSRIIEKISFEKREDTQKSNPSDSKKIILTSYGLNKPGVVFEISRVLAENECDIQDLSQKILQEYFTIIMIVDISHCKTSFNELRDQLQKLSESMGIRILIQHEDVFQYMHRI